MPLIPGKSNKTISKNISELHSGKTYSATTKKFGKKKADKQAVAIALNQSRKSSPKGSKGKMVPRYS